MAAGSIQPVPITAEAARGFGILGLKKGATEEEATRLFYETFPLAAEGEVQGHIHELGYERITKEFYGIESLKALLVFHKVIDGPPPEEGVRQILKGAARRGTLSVDLYKFEISVNGLARLIVEVSLMPSRFIGDDERIKSLNALFEHPNVHFIKGASEDPKERDLNALFAALNVKGSRLLPIIEQLLRLENAKDIPPETIAEYLRDAVERRDRESLEVLLGFPREIKISAIMMQVMVYGETLCSKESFDPEEQAIIDSIRARTGIAPVEGDQFLRLYQRWQEGVREDEYPM